MTVFCTLSIILNVFKHVLGTGAISVLRLKNKVGRNSILVGLLVLFSAPLEFDFLYAYSPEYTNRSSFQTVVFKKIR
jgi:hypothetical protein